MDEFKVGNVVQLKSGGEKMTISQIGYPYDDKIQCEWFDNKNIKRENFYPEMLVKVSTSND